MTISTLGIIGSGQLGSLLCQAAKKLNIKTIVISDDENGLGVSDLGQLSDSLEMHFWRSMMLRYCPGEPT